MFFRSLLISGWLLGAILPGSVAASSSSPRVHNVCPKPSGAKIQCFARVLPGADGVLRGSAIPAGYGPAQLRSAYDAPSGGISVVAVVGAYGDPAIESDLDTYSRTFGLPILATCGSAAQRACFMRTDQRGGQRYSHPNPGWALETALDVEAVHAMCLGCRINLIEADSPDVSDLMAAVDQAVASGSRVVSMSWGGGEISSETTTDAHFHHPGVIFVASSGDSGYGVSYPAASTQVLAVGGTHLELGAGGHRSESAWSGSGSGCSRYEPKPAWQHDPACSRRAIADIAADADPTTGAAVFSSSSPGGSGWFVVGGTSLAAPLVAGLVGVAGGGNQAAVLSRLYGSVGTPRLIDVVNGTNGRCTTYLCRATAGYDGPTGNGVPFGISSL